MGVHAEPVADGVRVVFGVLPGSDEGLCGRLQELSQSMSEDFDREAMQVRQGCFVVDADGAHARVVSV